MIAPHRILWRESVHAGARDGLGSGAGPLAASFGKSTDGGWTTAPFVKTMSELKNKSKISAAYDRWAETYDIDPNSTRELAYTVLKESNLELANRDVIEIGCGTGRNTQWLAERARNVIAVDFSQAMLAKAKARVHSTGVRFLQHDIRSPWPMADASADLFIVMLVLEHVECLEPFFAEAVRTLRVGGELFLCELHPMRQMSGGQAEFTNRENGKQERITAYLHDTAEYVNTAVRSGFDLVHLGECRDSKAQPSDMPRLIALHLRLRA
ncbi:MAG: class I SAM-dependent methyltransferase [Candidatus Binatia bacterium]